MSFILNSNEVDERDRADFVHEALAQTVVPMDLRWPEHRRAAQAHGVITDLGDLTVVSGRTTIVSTERTPSQARDSMRPSVFINLQLSGTSVLAQYGREAVLHPGELVMYDSTAPYRFFNPTGVSGEFFRIPHDALAMPHDMIRQSCAVSLGPGHPLTALTNDYLRRLASDRGLITAPDADLVGHPSIELIRAVLAIHLSADKYATEPLVATLQLRILHYAREHLHDPDLSAEEIANEHHISVRYLYKVLADSGISLAGWIRTHRLEACRDALAKAPAGTAIGTVARRFGFANMSSFSRAFRAEYGLSPREWRDRH